MPTLELFFSPGACSRVSLIALEETGAPYQAHPVLLSRGEHKQPDYLRLNAKGKVPLLIADGQALTENVAILTALSRWFPQARLLPTGALAAELQALSLLAWFASGIHPYITRAMLPQFISDDPAAAPRIRELGAAMLDKQLGLLDEMLAGRDWLLGDWSVADAYAHWVWSRIQGAPLDLSRHARLAAHAGRMEDRGSVQRALARERQAAM